MVTRCGPISIWPMQTLSEGLRTTLAGLRAVHSAGSAYGTGGYLDQVKELSSMAIAPSPDAYGEEVHPVVVVHPVTGRSALYVNPVYTTRFEGWSPVESQALLAHLHRHSINENFTCRLALGSSHPGDLGQPLHHAQRPQRLRRGPPGDVPDQRPRRRASRASPPGSALTAVTSLAHAR